MAARTGKAAKPPRAEFKKGTNSGKIKAAAPSARLFVLNKTAYERGCKNYLLKRFAASCILLSDSKRLVREQTKGNIMDTLHSGLHEIVDHRDHADIDYSRGASSVRPFSAAKTPVTPTTAGAGWYHDAAIEAAASEAIEARANPYHH